MKTIITIIFLLFSVGAFAAPYKCSVSGAVFADLGQCASSCGAVACDELIPADGNSGTCDTSAYRGFFTLGGKTYAVTNNPVTWDSASTVAIRNAIENELITKMLGKFGVTEAWIGAYDPDKSTDYGIVDKSRFRWRVGGELKYENWASGQPDNNLSGGSIGNSPVYGEHWGVIDASGKWSDIGLDNDGKAQLRYAVIEFQGELSCVSGKTGNVTSGMSGMYCSDNSAGADGLIKLDKCEVGIIFDNAGTGNICPIGKTACVDDVKLVTVKKEVVIEGQFPDAYVYGMEGGHHVTDFGGGINSGIKTPIYKYTVYNSGTGILNVRVDMSIKDEGITSCYGEGCGAPGPYSYTMPFGHQNFVVTPPLEPDLKFISSKISISNVTAADKESASATGDRVMPYIFTVEVETTIEEPIVVCPFTGRPCIENSGGYYCSPYDCADTAAGGITNDEETGEGTNDANNNGQYDEDGICMGEIVIFPGKDSRCRLPGVETAKVQCCNEMTVADTDKPDVRLSQEQVMAALYYIGGPAYWWLMTLASMIDINICNGSEKQLGVNRGYKQCKYVGRYCNKKWMGNGCLQMKETWCCYDSEFARAFAEAGMDLLEKSWGTPKSPNCRGFSPDELQQLSAMGISDHPKMREFAESIGAGFSDKLMKEFQNNFSPQSIQNDIEQQIQELEK